MRLLGVLGILLASTGAFAPAASAQPALAIDRVFANPSGWTVGANPNGGCLSAATYRDGTTVWFGFTASGESVLAFTNEAWKSIQPDRRYQIELRARGRGNWRGAFIGMQRRGEPGLYSTGVKNEFLVDLAAAGGIHIYFEGNVVARLSLSGSAAALRETISCQTRVAGTTPNSAARSAPRDDVPKESKSSSGTGFFVSKAGHVITNHHVIEGCRTYRIGAPGSSPVTARLIASDAANDLALLKTDLTPQAVAAFNSRPRLGSPVFVFGFPLGGILASGGNFTDGAITATAGMADDTRMLQISAPVQPGNSGGPVKDQSGNVVGVVVSKLNALRVARITNDVPQNVNFAIKAYIATNFMESHGVTPVTAAPGRPVDPADIAEEAKKFTVRVTCD